MVVENILVSFILKIGSFALPQDRESLSFVLGLLDSLRKNMLVFYDGLNLVNYTFIELLIFLHTAKLVSRVPPFYSLLCERKHIREIFIQPLEHLFISVVNTHIFDLNFCLRDFKHVFLNRLKVLDMLLCQPFIFVQLFPKFFVHSPYNFLTLWEFLQKSHWFLQQDPLMQKLVANFLLHSY